MAEKKVIIIPKKTRHELFNIESRKERLAAYCRVSTDSEEQESSYELQVQYYTKLINSMDNAVLVKVYADEGISGKSMKHRPQFMEMIDNCIKGNIDRILTKSISRFSRNAIDCVSQVRMLKDLGIAVKFEKEGLDSLEPGTDLILSIMSSIAEEESRSMSTNMKWTIQKRFAEGKIMNLPKYFLGYRLSSKGELYIVPSEAQIIRRIYDEYVQGYSIDKIAIGLMKDCILSPRGLENWATKTIKSILKNEKYKGDLLLQKTYNPDFLSKRVVNQGQVQQYFIEDNHAAIVSKEVFNKAQEMLDERTKIRSFSNSGHGRYSCKYPLSGRIYCSECGSKYRRYTGIYAKGEKKFAWVCINHKLRADSCTAKPVKEDVIMNHLIEQVEDYIGDKEVFNNKILARMNNVLNDKYAIKQAKVDCDIEKLEQDLLNNNKQFRLQKINYEEYEKKNAEIENEIHNRYNDRELIIIDQKELVSKEERLVKIKDIILGENYLAEDLDSLMRLIVDKIIIGDDKSVNIIFAE